MNYNGISNRSNSRVLYICRYLLNTGQIIKRGGVVMEKELDSLREDMLYIENQLRGIDPEELTQAEKNILRRVLGTRLIYEVINEDKK